MTPHPPGNRPDPLGIAELGARLDHERHQQSNENFTGTRTTRVRLGRFLDHEAHEARDGTRANARSRRIVARFAMLVAGSLAAVAAFFGYQVLKPEHGGGTITATSTSAVAPPPLPVTPAGSEPPVYSYGPTYAYAPNWGVSLTQPSWVGTAVAVSDFAVDAVSGVHAQPNVAFAEVATTPDYATCRAANYTIMFIPLAALTPSKALCVRRADGRVGQIQLSWNGQKTANDQPPFKVHIEGVVWEPAR